MTSDREAKNLLLAHTIRNWSTNQFKAVHQLHSRSRWCMTGTPIQNSLEDLGALVRFIRLPSLDDLSKFRRHIIGGTAAAGHFVRPNFENLKIVLASICIRRSNSLLKLPGLDYRDCRPVFDPEERHQYNSLVKECHRAMEKTSLSFQGGSGLLECLLRLRLFCNGGKASLRGDTDFLTPNDRTLSILQQTGDADCVYCHCEVLAVNSDAAGQRQDGTSHLTCCGRLVCAECIPTYMSQVSVPFKCPLCTSTSAYSFEKAEQAKPQGKLGGPPSKIATLLQNIRDHRSDEKWYAHIFNHSILPQHITGAKISVSVWCFLFGQRLSTLSRNI